MENPENIYLITSMLRDWRAESHSPGIVRGRNERDNLAKAKRNRIKKRRKKGRK